MSQKTIIDQRIEQHHLMVIQHNLVIIDSLREKIAILEVALAETERKWREERDLRIVAEENQCSCDIRGINPAAQRVVGTRLPKEGEIVAVNHRDNSDGEGDIDYQLAYVKDGIWCEYHDGRPLIEYVGDAIIEWWPLVHGAGINV